MKLFGFDITRKAATGQPTGSGIWRRILEPFTGAWQKNIEETQGDLTTYPTLYACLWRVSSDIGKLPFTLKRASDSGVNTTVTNPSYSPVLRKPNDYQTAQQFREAWMLSKLQHGNTYVLKQRDSRGVVIRMFVLDPTRVLPMVAPGGEVFYRVSQGSDVSLAPVGAGQVTIPAYEIMHDRLNCFHHQMIGVPPLCAAYWPAVKNLKILKSAAAFFANNSQPGGILSAPAGMSEKDADALKAYWQDNYTGDNAGKTAVIGADVKFTPFAMKSADSQLVEQMTYSDQQICQPFGVPPFIVGIGNLPSGLKADDMANVYYRFALQSHIEAMEALLEDGLRISAPLSVELDTYALLRMDTEKRGAVFGGLISNGIATPNEARQEFNFPPLEGGDTVYMQQQDFPLDQVRLNRIAPPEPAQAPPAPENPDVKALMAWKRAQEMLAETLEAAANA